MASFNRASYLTDILIRYLLGLCWVRLLGLKTRTAHGPHPFTLESLESIQYVPKVLAQRRDWAFGCH